MSQRINQASEEGSWRETERAEYVRTTVRRRLTKGHLLGMGAGIAKKPGNAGGVKAPTAVARVRRNIYYTLR